MSNPFAAYGHKATTTAAPRLVGPMKRRADARLTYAAIVAELAQCSTPAEVQKCLSFRVTDVTQFKAELEFLWSGDDMFLGLEKEIAWATARVDAGLDFPRWEPAHSSLHPEAADHETGKAI